ARELVERRDERLARQQRLHAAPTRVHWGTRQTAIRSRRVGAPNRIEVDDEEVPGAGPATGRSAVERVAHPVGLFVRLRRIAVEAGAAPARLAEADHQRAA